MFCLKYVQQLSWSLEKSWKFFSNPKNLKDLTPPHLGFEILNDVAEEMYAGQIISYTIRPVLGIPINWVTEITHVEKGVYFIDEQRFGPYAFWHHEHRFEANDTGVEMTDTIYYKLPLGPVGILLNHFKVRGDIEAIFTYRQRKLAP